MQHVNYNYSFRNQIKPVKRNSYLSNLRHLTNKDVTKAAYTLLEAFAEDDLAKMLVCHIEDKAERQLCELTLYEAYIRQHIAKGIVIGQGETESGFETVSIWSHPKSEEEGLDSYTNLMEAGYGKVWNVYGEEGRKKCFTECYHFYMICVNELLIVILDSKIKRLYIGLCWLF